MKHVLIMIDKGTLGIDYITVRSVSEGISVSDMKHSSQSLNWWVNNEVADYVRNGFDIKVFGAGDCNGQIHRS